MSAREADLARLAAICEAYVAMMENIVLFRVPTVREFLGGESCQPR